MYWAFGALCCRAGLGTVVAWPKPKPVRRQSMFGGRSAGSSGVVAGPFSKRRRAGDTRGLAVLGDVEAIIWVRSKPRAPCLSVNAGNCARTRSITAGCHCADRAAAERTAVAQPDSCRASAAARIPSVCTTCVTSDRTFLFVLGRTAHAYCCIIAAHSDTNARCGSISGIVPSVSPAESMTETPSGDGG